MNALEKRFIAKLKADRERERKAKEGMRIALDKAHEATKRAMDEKGVWHRIAHKLLKEIS